MPSPKYVRKSCLLTRREQTRKPDANLGSSMKEGQKNELLSMVLLGFEVDAEPHRVR